VLDIDVKGYFDSIDWSLLLKAVRLRTDCPWVLLYIERWLKAPVRMEDGSVVPRMAGTPQGGVISPILANLFLHYAFDMWMTRTFPAIPFERYADDCICHCRSEEEARALWEALEARFAACGLVLHPQKTKLVYCKDTNRRGLSDPIVHLSRLHVPAEEGDVARRSIRRLVLACCQSRRAEGNQADDPKVGTPSSERYGPGRSGAEIQSVYPWLDQLLQSLLQVGTGLDIAPG
jgi:hypothetical protein